jgi:hypothetical protein
MKNKFNWQTAIMAFALVEVMLFATGCGSTISQIGNLLPAIGTLLSAVVAFITGLSTSLPATVQNDIKIISEAADTGIVEAESLLKSWTQSTSTTILGKVGDILNSVLGSLNSMLGDLGLTGSAAQKVQELVGLAVTAIEGVLSLIPMFGNAAKASPHALGVMDKAGASQVKALHEHLKASYAEIVGTPTGDAAVDAALAQLPKSL